MADYILDRIKATYQHRGVRIVLNLLGIIVLGALGSGLWEALLRPVFRHGGYWVLDLSSFGIETLRRDTYREIAKSATNVGNTEGLFIVVWVYVLVLLIALGALFARLWHVESKHLSLTRRIELEKTPNQQPELSLEEKERRIRAIGPVLRRARRSLYGSACLAGVLIVGHLVEAERVSYINSALIHYQQVLKIASPFISDADRRQIESRFAQVESKADYMMIVDGLTRTAQEHGQRVPDFPAW